MTASLTGFGPVATPSVPWRPADASRVLFANLVGGALLTGGYLGTSGTARLSHQLNWVSVAVVGLSVAGAANVLWLLAGRRAVGLRLRALLIEHDPLQVPTPLAVVTAVPEQRRAEGLVTVALGTRVHRADCLLVRGKPLIAHLPTAKKGRSLVLCEACAPGAP